MKQITIKNDYDVVIIGAGPAGLSFACSLAEKKIRTLIVERSSIDSISNPQPDGREIAITHQSRKILNELGVSAFKIASADLVNLPLIKHVSEKFKPISVKDLSMLKTETIMEEVKKVLN